jgi:hypothetical protein
VLVVLVVLLLLLLLQLQFSSSSPLVPISLLFCQLSSCSQILSTSMTISSHAVSAILSRLSCSCQHLKKPFSTLLKSCFYVHKLASCSGNKPQLASFFFSEKKHHPPPPPPPQQQQPPLKKSNNPTTTTPAELLASYRAFFAQNLCRSSSFFSVTATTFRYTQESSNSHPASFLSLTRPLSSLLRWR